MDVDREEDPDLREQDTMKKFGWEEDFFQVKGHRSFVMALTFLKGQIVFQLGWSDLETEDVEK